MKPMIVAEIGANHLGDFIRAGRLIQEALGAGANAVKFQCFTPEQMVDAHAVIQTGPWAGRNALNLYRETQTPRAWFPDLFDYCRAVGLMPFASVFHPDDVDFLETLGCPMYKIASFEITDLNLIEHAGSTGKTVIISTGMATYEEIKRAFFAVPSGTPLTLLKCTSSYPAPISEANISTIADMRARFGNVGLSDHTLGHTAAVVATAFGATMIEKHFTLQRSDGGPDAAFSAEPHEFRAMVEACRDAAMALGEVHYGPVPSEAHSLPLRRAPGGKRASK